MDVCFGTQKLYDETDPTWDYYAIHVYGTAFANGPFGITNALVKASRSTTGAVMYWVDWSPAADTTGACWGSPYTLGITEYGVGLSYTASPRCETWHIIKSNPAVVFSNEWQCTGCALSGVHNTSRAVALLEGVKIAQGGYPVWYVQSALRGCNGLFCNAVARN